MKKAEFMACRLLPFLVLALALCGTAAGLAAMRRFETTAGKDLAAPPRWPAESGLPHAADEPTLLLFAHPRCPCTAASLAEFAELLGTPATPVRAAVIFFEPGGAADRAWLDTESVRRASAISGTTVERDPAGREAARFHVLTSGRVLLYSAGGELLFDGGITAARGHLGENAGRSALAARLSHRPASLTRTPVFGCPILPPALSQP